MIKLPHFAALLFLVNFILVSMIGIAALASGLSYWLVSRLIVIAEVGTALFPILVLLAVKILPAVREVKRLTEGTNIKGVHTRL